MDKKSSGHRKEMKAKALNNMMLKGEDGQIMW